VELDGIFLMENVFAARSGISRNRPIDADRRRNQANRGSLKFLFEIKSANF
jgi:hypothetical protein